MIDIITYNKFMMKLEVSISSEEYMQTQKISKTKLHPNARVMRFAKFITNQATLKAS